jgi:hypothetical protein
VRGSPCGSAARATTRSARRTPTGSPRPARTTVAPPPEKVPEAVSRIRPRLRRPP